MNNPGLIKTFLAGAAVEAYTIVKPGADDDHVITSAAAANAHIGVTGALGAAAAEDQLDVIMSGCPLVELGGTVTRGGPVTSDASGKAVAATADGERIIGFVLNSGVVGDLVAVQISPGYLSVAA